jgi:hypothetical protein
MFGLQRYLPGRTVTLIAAALGTTMRALSPTMILERLLPEPADYPPQKFASAPNFSQHKLQAFQRRHEKRRRLPFHGLRYHKC